MELCKKETFCLPLWEDAFINQMGDVYCCCHWKPRKLGNIYKETLKDICNNRIIQSLRQKSLNGELECFNDCTRLDKDTIVYRSKPLIINYNELKLLDVTFGTACNINCIMCWQDRKSKERLDYEKLIKNVDITPFERIRIEGGEPLFIESANKFYDYAASKGKKVTIETNGILINDEWAKKIALYSSDVIISLNAATKRTHEFINRGSKWEVVLKNIQRVREAREKYGTNAGIKGHMTIVAKNLEEIPLAIKTYKQLGFDSMDFGYDLSVPRYLKTHPLKKIILKQKIENALKASGDRFVINPHRLRLLGLAK